MRKIDVTLDTGKLLGWQKGNAEAGMIPTSKVGDGPKGAAASR